jgi:IMP dehydrogenase
MDIEIAPGKRAHQAYSFDDIAIVPSRRTRTPEDVSTAWQIDAYKFDHLKPQVLSASLAASVFLT